MNTRYHHIFHIAAVVVYLGICIFDFIVVPSFMGLTRDPYPELIPLIKDLSPEVASVIVQRPYWEPLTLKGGGLFHLAFGAIITGGVFSKDNKLSDFITRGKDS